MLKDWPRMAQELNTLVSRLRGRQSDVMRAFSQQAQAALKPTTLDTKTKELIALAVSVAIRCDPCITFHAKAAVAAGASDEEIGDAMGVAIYMGAGPSVMYAAQALEAVQQWRTGDAGDKD
ncbi:carboxymuconolactone decarboxylase family protein [Candidatus Viadribacter manganicus]|uniref:Carboxymuconolactone decarboxylase n=1 Tax=Candidatus Viadribacter manganicus TaxID=1759059 RepID=A0A1B1AJK8_9PROT|nr:carboxymuconolactone decarboxylase [Candidatus Viadribacter manganicus]